MKTNGKELKKLDDSYFDKKERGGYGGTKRKYRELQKEVK